MSNQLNRLAKESSLYLKQHANNPVDWYPWNEEALTKAKQENKPILLSIGYSACHWCHVMANESFSDFDTAELMNKYFINIKVDREERPDLDKIYQQAQQLLNGRAGGWPLTMFLTPDDLTPFFGGTYFPLEPRYGMPSFKTILQKVVDVYHKHHAEIKQQNQRVQQALQHLSIYPAAQVEQLTSSPLKKAIAELAQSYDKENGGFGQAPKFPHPTSLNYLLHYYLSGENVDKETAKIMAQQTLLKMAQSGIYDQVGGGFYRYSVDAQWQIPHFEKMLYDNAQLLSVYAQASNIFAEPYFKTITEEIVEWSVQEMHNKEGGFYSTLDADSEHEEGKFYYWNKDEIKSLLTQEEFAAVNEYFNLQQAANFEGHWHLTITHDLQQTAKVLKLDINAAQQLIHSARAKLLKIRNQRIRPGRDEKILTSWNALMIKGLALAGRLLERNDFIEKAEQSVDFIYQHLWKNNRLLACYQNGKAYLSAYLDDYAFLLDALLTLLQARWNSQYLNFAINLAEILLKQFADSENDGFFFTAHDHEILIQRPKPLMDEAVPAGNGVAAVALTRLGHLLGELRYLKASEAILKMAWNSLQEYPSAHVSLLTTLAEYLEPPQLIILRGTQQQLSEWQRVTLENYSPSRLVFAIPVEDREVPDILTKYQTDSNKICAYICQGQKCKTPIMDLVSFKELLS